MPAGFGGVVVAAKVSHAGTLNVQRYADLAGAVPVGAVITQALTADTAAWAGASDGLPFLSYNVQIVNGAGAASIPAYVIILTGQPY
jgi:hypothetical protein